MKVLTFCNYLSDDGYEVFKRNRSGYGYVVADIVKGLSVQNSVFVFAYSGFSSGFNYKNATILNNRPLKLLLKGASFSSYLRGFIYLIRNINKGKEALRVFYSYLVRNALKKAVFEADIVHFHGVTPNLMPLMDYCEDRNKTILVTLHGLNSFSKYNKASQYIKLNERRFLRKLVQSDKVFLSVLTPKAKEIIVSCEGERVANKIRVIPNFLSNDIWPESSEELEGASNKVLYVGNISKQKNQAALITTILKYKKELENYSFYFVGEMCGGVPSEQLKLICELKNVVFTGHLERRELSQLYQQSKLTVLLSKDEGFGMSIIEGFKFGVPTLISEKIEIASLISELEYVETVSDVQNTDEIYVKLKKMLDDNVDRNKVVSYANNYSQDAVILKYNNYFQNLLSK